MRPKIAVDSTLIRPGVPSSAGTSKDSTVTMKPSSIAASRLGSASGSVIRRRIRQRLAPAIAAACSSAGSAARNAGAISRKSAGKSVVACTKMMPGIVYTSIVGRWPPSVLFTLWLMKLPLGPINRIQPIAWMIVGTAKATTTVR